MVSTLPEALPLSGRKVALVGNAESLIKNPRADICGHDVVVRINRGIEVAAQTGCERTDLLLVSAFTTRLPKLLSGGMPIAYMSPAKRVLIEPAARDLLHYYPVEHWQELFERIGHRPSTGCMGIDMLSRLIGNGQLHLYGFDFWNSPTSYNGINRPGPHNPSAEERYALEVVGADNIH